MLQIATSTTSTTSSRLFILIKYRIDASQFLLTIIMLLLKQSRVSYSLY
jgi:hypothetical protein